MTDALADNSRVVVKAIADGELTPEEGASVLQALASQVRIIEADEIEKRLAALEAAAGRKGIAMTTGSAARRLDRLEEVIRPAEPPKCVIGHVDYDDYGNPASLEMCERTLAPLPGESEEAMCARAIEACGPFDHVIWVSYVKAKDGRPAPGFERFANCQP